MPYLLLREGIALMVHVRCHSVAQCIVVKHGVLPGYERELGLSRESGGISFRPRLGPSCGTVEIGWNSRGRWCAVVSYRLVSPRLVACRIALRAPDARIGFAGETSVVSHPEESRWMGRRGEMGESRESSVALCDAPPNRVAWEGTAWLGMARRNAFG
jgi:hypothetical protein